MSQLIKTLKNTKFLVDSYPKTWDLSKSTSSWLVDSSGVEYLDFNNGFGSGALGYNNMMLNVLMSDTDSAYLINKPSNSDFYTEPFVNFVETFKKTTLAQTGVENNVNYPYLFFVDGGALAVENALKVAFDWKARLLGFKEYEPIPTFDVIHFQGSFHGRSGYTMSLTNTDPVKTGFFPKFDWSRFEAPHIVGLNTLNESDIVVQNHRESMVLDRIESNLQNNSDNVAAIIIETIQCEGGDRYFSKYFLLTLQELCHKYNVLFIMDEVQTGFYTSGKPWCFQHYELTPDVVSFGKKSQQCGIFASNRLDMIDRHCFNTPSRINSTWGGNLIDMIRSTHIMNIIKTCNLDANVTQQGEHWLENISSIKTDKIKNIRGLGGILSFDCQSSQERDNLVDILYNHCNHLVLSCGESTVRFRPNLTVTSNEIDSSAERIQCAIEKI